TARPDAALVLEVRDLDPGVLCGVGRSQGPRRRRPAMNGLDLLFALDSEPLALRAAALSLLLAFGLTQALGAIYVWTFRGMSYSQGLVHAIVLGSIIACMLMLAIGNSIAAGLGI